MGTQTLTKTPAKIPALFDDFFKPLNDWFSPGRFWGQTMNIPAVNISEEKDEYLVSVAVPGMKKDDFKIDIDGNMLSISCEKSETIEEKEKKFTRKEFNFSSFNRCFTLPDEISKDKIEARYEDGVLKLSLPFTEASRKNTAKHIAVK